MGDHRANIKIEMEFHGVKDHCDFWINYMGENQEYYGVDDRIIEFIRDIYEKGMSKFNEEMVDYWKQEKEKEERIKLKRLKDKYND